MSSAEEKEKVVICRACINECSQYKSLYKEGLIMGEVTTLAALLSFCTNLEFTPEEDALPSHICARCVVRLAKSYVFRTKVLEANETLRKQLGERLDGMEVEDYSEGIVKSEYVKDAIGVGELQELATAAQMKRDMDNIEFVTLTVLEETVDEEEGLEVEHEQHIVACVADDDDGVGEGEGEDENDGEGEDDGDGEGNDEGDGEGVDEGEDEEEVDTEEEVLVHDIDDSDVYNPVVNDSDEQTRGDYEIISLDGNLQQTEDEGDEECETNTYKHTEVDEPDIGEHNTKRTFKPRFGGMHAKPPNPELKCKFCGKQLSNANSLKYHMQLHSDSTPYLCSLCGEGFKTRNAYEGHIVIHDPNNPNTCELCGKSYRQSSSLRTHMLSHTGEKPYQCDICGKGMTQKSGYKKHLLIHSGEKPHSCDICGRDFRYSSNLIAHRRCHSDDKPYSCPHCEKCFHTTEQRKRHLLVHTGEKLYPCEVCGKKFKRRSSVSAHRHTHIGTPHNGVRGLVEQKVFKSNVVELY